LVWVLGPYPAPTCRPFLSGAAYRVLDLDEDDAVTLRAAADLRARRSETEDTFRAASEVRPIDGLATTAWTGSTG
jgi:hypothetical protein